MHPQVVVKREAVEPEAEVVTVRIAAVSLSLVSAGISGHIAVPAEVAVLHIQ